MLSMMTLQERIESMEKLSEYIGKKVDITYVDLHCKKAMLSGVLNEVEGYYNISLGEEGGIPFIGEPTAIMSIVSDGDVLYENPYIFPSYIPSLSEYPSDQKSSGIARELVDAYRKAVRELSFGVTKK